MLQLEWGGGLGGGASWTGWKEREREIRGERERGEGMGELEEEEEGEELIVELIEAWEEVLWRSFESRVVRGELFE